LKVLQICHKVPFPPTDGGAQLVHYATMGLVANNVKVKVVALNPTRNHINIENLPLEYIESIDLETVRIETKLNIFKAIRNLVRHESYFIERFYSIDFEKKLRSILEFESFDIVQLEHLYLCRYIELIRKLTKAKIILRPQNIEHVIWKRFRKSVNNPLKKFFLDTSVERLKIFEERAPHLVDGIMPLTDEDMFFFRNLTSKIPIWKVPMGYNYENLKNYDFDKQYLSKPIVYHLASMDWLPNIEAMRWFFKKVVPLLYKKNIHFSIAGRNMPQWIYKYRANNIEIKEVIDHPLAYQENKSIMIVPLWSGSGIRAKIIEGLALGKTIISTTIGAQGIEFENGHDMIIADTPFEFARQIERCCNSPWLCKEIGRNARKLSHDYYHYMGTGRKMVSFYNNLLC
jgi:polysaccharide biosynthesis protein PslH